MAVPTSLSLRRRSKWVEAGLAAVSGVGVVIGASEPGMGSAIGEGTLLLALPVLAATMFLYRRTAPVLPFAVSAVLTALSPAVFMSLFISSYAVGRYEPRWPLRIGAAVVGFVAVAQLWSVDGAEAVFGNIVGGALAILLPGVVGAWVRIRAELLTALRERAERAEAAQELLARDAVLTERTRIAREMHDAVGHRVSLMVLQAGAIEMAAGDRERVERLAENVQIAGRQALDELRQAVGVLRSGEHEDAPLAPQPGLDDLERLVKECRTAGMNVQLHAPAALGLDPAVSRAAYRIVQEALTNAGKHAPEAPVTVDVERPAEELVIRVVNGTPRRTVERAPGGGFGLVGLAERVRTLGGRLRAEPRLDGGFVVEAALPVHRTDEPAASTVTSGDAETR
jgi:signal transduction histidine kinase